MLSRQTVRLSLFSLIAGLLVCAMMPASAKPDQADAARIFSEAKVICERDNGALWKHSLCGPMFLVDPNDLAVVANQQDKEHRLSAAGQVYTGVLTDDIIVANTPTDWLGVHWTQLYWPLPEDSAKRHVLLAHELFHRIQPELGLSRPEMANHHLDTFDGRYLLRLEWRALEKALKATTSAARHQAINDALLFRRSRYRLFPKGAAEEGALETNEGVPEYTGVMLGLSSPKARINFAVSDLHAFIDAPTFVRSFAYATGPAYGLLLDQADTQWRSKIRSGLRFDELLATALALPEPAFAKLKARTAVYDKGALRDSENARESRRLAEEAALKARLVDGPVISIPLSKANYQFNPQTLKSLGQFGTVYPTMRLTDSWGELVVEQGGALVNNAFTLAVVTAKGIDTTGQKGDGWQMKLSPGWTIKPGQRAGDFQISPVDKN